MKFPISKQLTEYLFYPCLASAGVAIYDLCTTGQKRIDQNIVFMFLFGLPTILFGYCLYNKNTRFKVINKVSEKNIIFKLPFSSVSTSLIIIFSSFLLIGGLAEIVHDKDLQSGLPMLLVSLLVIAFNIICLEHPKIWFSDTFNLEDLSEKIKNTPNENFPAYQDGIFTYNDNSFTIQLESEEKSINWNEITLIRAYKIDHFTFDSIIFEIYLEDISLKISDETVGYGKFMEIASEKLTNFKKDWFLVVAFPAFERNLTIIYERQQIIVETKGSH